MHGKTIFASSFSFLLGLIGLAAVCMWYRPFQSLSKHTIWDLAQVENISFRIMHFLAHLHHHISAPLTGGNWQVVHI
jgi:hypothetical protein